MATAVDQGKRDMANGEVAEREPVQPLAVAVTLGVIVVAVVLVWIGRGRAAGSLPEDYASIVQRKLTPPETIADEPAMTRMRRALVAAERVAARKPTPETLRRFVDHLDVAIPVYAAGGDDPDVLEALSQARRRRRELIDRMAVGDDPLNRAVAGLRRVRDGIGSGSVGQKDWSSLVKSLGSAIDDLREVTATDVGGHDRVTVGDSEGAGSSAEVYRRSVLRSAQYARWLDERREWLTDPVSGWLADGPADSEADPPPFDGESVFERARGMVTALPPKSGDRGRSDPALSILNDLQTVIRRRDFADFPEAFSEAVDSLSSADAALVRGDCARRWLSVAMETEPPPDTFELSEALRLATQLDPQGDEVCRWLWVVADATSQRPVGGYPDPLIPLAERTAAALSDAPTHPAASVIGLMRMAFDGDEAGVEERLRQLRLTQGDAGVRLASVAIRRREDGEHLGTWSPDDRPAAWVRLLRRVAEVTGDDVATPIQAYAELRWMTLAADDQTIRDRAAFWSQRFSDAAWLRSFERYRSSASPAAGGK